MAILETTDLFFIGRPLKLRCAQYVVDTAYPNLEG